MLPQAVPECEVAGLALAPHFLLEGIDGSVDVLYERSDQRVSYPTLQLRLSDRESVDVPQSDPREEVGVDRRVCSLEDTFEALLELIEARIGARFERDRGGFE